MDVRDKSADVARRELRARRDFAALRVAHPPLQPLGPIGLAGIVERVVPECVLIVASSAASGRLRKAALWPSFPWPLRGAARLLSRVPRCATGQPQEASVASLGATKAALSTCDEYGPRAGHSSAGRERTKSRRDGSRVKPIATVPPPMVSTSSVEAMLRGKQ